MVVSWPVTGCGSGFISKMAQSASFGDLPVFAHNGDAQTRSYSQMPKGAVPFLQSVSASMHFVHDFVHVCRHEAEVRVKAVLSVVDTVACGDDKFLLENGRCACGRQPVLHPREKQLPHHSVRPAEGLWGDPVTREWAVLFQ